jgi:glycosyltransferase involved in cell wall biosynthesis
MIEWGSAVRQRQAESSHDVRMTVSRPKSEADVLILGPVPPPLGGISVHISRVVPQLQEEGFAVQVLNHFDSTAPSYVVGTLRRNPLRYYVLPRRIPARVLHYHHSHWLALLAVAAGRGRRRTRYILTSHGDDLRRLLRSKIPGQGALTRWALKRFDVIIVVNDKIRRTLEAESVDRPIEVLPAFLLDQSPGAPYELPLDEFLSAGPGLVLPAFRVQFLADGRDVYGLDTAVDAFATVAGDRPNLRLTLFLAERPERRKPAKYLQGLMDRLERAGLHQRAKVVFGLPLTPAFRHEVVLIRPSRMDGDALSIREALEAGVPVVASDAVERPPGVVTFVTDDAADLAQKLRAVLDRRSDNLERGDSAADGNPAPGDADFLARLIRIYRRELERAR